MTGETDDQYLTNFGHGVLKGIERVDKRGPRHYNIDEERTTHAVAPQLLLVCSLSTTKRQSSLGGVAAAFFALEHDDRDGILSNMERNSHGPHLLSEM